MNVRNNLLLLLVLSCHLISAQNTVLIFNQSDGTRYRENASAVDSICVSEDERYVTFSLANSREARVGLTTFDSLTFVKSADDIAVFPTPEDVTSSFSESFNPIYSDITENVVTDNNDFVENYKPGTIITVTYSQIGATISGNYDKNLISVTTDGAYVTIRSAAKRVRYILTGTTDNGYFKIYSDNKFILELADVNITNPNGAAINNQSGKSCCVILNQGTTNTLRDGSTYVMTAGEDQKAALFSEGQLIFSDKGTLNITSISAHGICSDDYVRLRSNCGNITINAAKDGINTNDHFIMYGGTVSITSSDDGISVDKGFVSVNGGKLIVRSVDKGIQADYNATDTTHIDIAGGFIDIETTGSKGHAITSTGKINLTGGAFKAVVNGAGSKCIISDCDIVLGGITAQLTTKGAPVYNDLFADYSSAAAIRSKRTVSFNGADINMRSTGKGGKGINATDSVTIADSRIIVITTGESFSSGSDFVHPRAIDASTVNMHGGILKISSSHAAIAAENLTVNGGNIFAYTTRTAKCLNIATTPIQTGGLLLFNAE